MVKRFDFPIEEAIDNVSSYFRMSLKRAASMSEDELLAAEEWCSEYVDFVEHPCFVQAVPRAKGTGRLLLTGAMQDCDMDVHQMCICNSDTDPHVIVYDIDKKEIVFDGPCHDLDASGFKNEQVNSYAVCSINEYVVNIGGILRPKRAAYGFD